MSINIDTYNINQQSYAQATCKKNALHKLLGIETKNIKSSKTENASKTDSYIPSVECQLWVSKIEVRGTCITQSVLDRINFGEKNFGGNETEFIVDGVVYSYDQIPSVTLDVCNEIKAENNAIVLEAGKYYKFNDEQGTPHILACTEYRISQPYSDSICMRGIHDKESAKRGKFWSMMSSNGFYISLYFSEDEQRQILKEAGITDGFFSVQVGDKKQEYYYSDAIAGVAVLKTRYDEAYNMYTRPGTLFRDDEPGTIYVFDGKEYALKEDKTFDIPYGIDIFDIQYPKRNYSEL